MQEEGGKDAALRKENVTGKMGDGAMAMEEKR